MSDTPELNDREALAAEHALGVLSAAERAEAEARMARDPAFAAEVEAWRARFEPLVDEIAAVTPPQALWDRIAGALPANEDPGLTERLRFWKRATAGLGVLAAASLAAVVVLAVRPPTVIREPAPASPMLNASLAGQGGGLPLFIAVYDPARRALVVTSMVQPGADPAHVHELWLIPGDGRPRSLGFVEPGTMRAMPIPAGLQAMMAEGSALAISVEPPGGSPTRDAPSGPVAASGKLGAI